MKALLPPLLITVLSCSVAASPVESQVQSLEHLARIGAKITISKVVWNEKSVYNVIVRWKSKVSDDPIGSRLDLIVRTEKRESENALQVRYAKNADGVFEADFTVSSSELDRTQLFFRESQQDCYILEVEHLVRGFPALEPTDPFEGNNKKNKPKKPSD